MTSELEDNRIHHILAELLQNYGQPSYFIFLQSVNGITTSEQVLLLNRLNDLQLTRSSVDDKLYIELTLHGVDVARHPNGYIGYKQEEAARRAQQQQAQDAREELDRQAALATVSSAESAVSATRAAWVAAGFGLASIILSIVTLVQPDKSEQLQGQLNALQQQVILLKAQVATQAQLLDQQKQLERKIQAAASSKTSSKGRRRPSPKQ